MIFHGAKKESTFQQDTQFHGVKKETTYLHKKAEHMDLYKEYGCGTCGLTDAQFIQWVHDALQDGAITEAQSLDLLKQFNAQGQRLNKDHHDKNDEKGCQM